MVTFGSMLRRSALAFTASLLLHSGSMAAVRDVPAEKEKATVSVACSRASGLIEVNILNYRKIGKVRLVVKDAAGELVYVEEGKALSDVLVRRLDKSMLPKGAATVTVEARDFTITQAFTVQ